MNTNNFPFVFKNEPELLKNTLSQVDRRGNTPVLLCIILHYNKKEAIFDEILELILENGANYKLKDRNQWTPLSIAITYGDKEMVEILYRFYSKRREEKIKTKFLLIANYFKNMNDFYVEIKWKVKIPLLSFLCPNDTIKITKFGPNTRADFTFVDYKRLSVIRKQLSYYLKFNDTSQSLDIMRVDRELNEYCDPVENLDEEEIQLVLKDLMNKQRMNGSFKILECKLEENNSYFDKNKKIFEVIHGYTAQQYTLNLTVRLDRHPNEIIDYIDLNEDNYLDEKTDIIKDIKAFGDKDLHKGLQDGLHIKNTTVIKGIKELEKEKKMKATVWVVHNSPIKSEDAVHLIESIASTNEFMDKVLEFFHHPDIKKIIDNNGFPIKVEIPYNIFIDLTFSFDNYMTITGEIQNIKNNYK